MTSASRFTTVTARVADHLTPVAVLMLALAALLGAGCGKTDAIGDRVRRDPRTGPLVSQGGGGASLPVVTPRWDPATVANGFLPVPPVEEHPPFEHR